MSSCKRGILWSCPCEHAHEDAVVYLVWAFAKFLGLWMSLYLVQVVLILEHPIAWRAVWVASGSTRMLSSSRFRPKAAITILAFPVRLILRVVAMGIAVIDVLVIAVLGIEVTITFTAVWHFSLNSLSSRRNCGNGC